MEHAVNILYVTMHIQTLHGRL